MKHTVSVIAIVALAAACASSPEPSQAGPDPRTPPAAPWSAPALAASSVPAVYVAVWRDADNRATCAPIAFATPVQGAQATPRAATFSGGWAVAWDLPGQRSAFGIAGTGARADEPSYDEWPHRRTWADGSSAGWGPEGGTGPKQLAYLRIAGQDCLYNVWSALGREHLEALLGEIRFVETPR